MKIFHFVCAIYEIEALSWQHFLYNTQSARPSIRTTPLEFEPAIFYK